MAIATKLSIEEYFTYHPVVTEDRRLAHEAVNAAALAFARVLEDNVKDEKTKDMAFFCIQQARMFANQGVTVDELVLTRQG